MDFRLFLILLDFHFIPSLISALFFAMTFSKERGRGVGGFKNKN